MCSDDNGLLIVPLARHMIDALAASVYVSFDIAGVIFFGVSDTKNSDYQNNKECRPCSGQLSCHPALLSLSRLPTFSVFAFLPLRWHRIA